MLHQLKLTALVAGLTLFTIGTASANPWHHHHHNRFYFGVGGPVYPYPPVVVAPPIVAPPPVVVAPPPAFVPAPVPAMYAPAPVYSPVYTYGGVGPRGYGFGYASPGFGVYIGR